MEENIELKPKSFYSKLPKSLTTVTTFSKLIALFLFILLPFAGFVIGMKYQEKVASIERGDNQVACTAEAKLCPDGSAVSRTGPNCEFAPCSTGSISPIPTIDED